MELDIGHGCKNEIRGYFSFFSHLVEFKTKEDVICGLVDRNDSSQDEEIVSDLDSETGMFEVLMKSCFVCTLAGWCSRISIIDCITVCCT